MAWLTSGVVSNPASGTLLLDSGALAAGAFVLPLLLVSSDTPGMVRLEWRNAANSANKQSHIFIIGDSQIFDLSVKSITVLVNERVRLVTVGDMVGNIQVSALT